MSGGPSRVGDRVQQARDRVFAGRAAELGVFRSALSGDGKAPAVLYVHGPGGIGKSMLLRRFAAEARAAGREVVEVDGRLVEPAPEAFEKEAGAVLTDERAVLLVDTFERCQGLEGWLRDRFLVRLPVGALVVIAGRRPPDTGWTSDPGWADLLCTVALRNLAPDEATAFLHARGVPQDTRPALLAFTGGHPLALALAAAVAVRDSAGSAGWEPGRDAIATLLPRLIGEVPSPVHRRALEVCARAYVTTETLLRAVLGDDAAPMFAWLRGLPFVESARHGLFPHDVVREVLEADLRWRDPEGYAELHGRLSLHLLEQIRSAPESAMLPAVGAFMYLFRTDRYMADYNSWRGGEVVSTACEPADHATVLDLVTEVEGPASATAARFWLDRQPEAFRVCRTARDDEIVGFSAWLQLTEPYGGDVDPVVAAAWSHTRGRAALRDGEHLAMARFSVTSPRYPKISPVEDLHQWRGVAEVARAEGRVAWMYVAIRSGDFWRPYLTSLGLTTIGDRPRVGHLTYDLYAVDWRTLSVRAWAEQRTRLLLSGVSGALEKPTAVSGQSAEYAVLSRPEFDTAVRDALRELSRAEDLALNPLARSRLTGGPGAELPDLLAEAVDALRAERGGEKYHRAVAATYLHGAPTQEAVAARLGLPFSTYRRHLTVGVARVCDALWRREIYGTDPR
ncbi:ATP-binding protein [Streptomyces sp. S.PB5]|uniref:ATP-binding protein n=1 Tax=Streptomyces sp. S.PB5 TaxID=3020844 RepID=UPI0025AF7B00|nr:ATP-binding protein [Streptomyces sp. S.PB5]MDN3025947.1 ATP-binding protein [Streptomyces sp. S.PB5]